MGHQRRVRLRALALLLGLSVVLVSCGGGAPSATRRLSVSSTLDPTGILLVGIGEEVQPRAPTQALSEALGQATQFVDAHADDVGYPWIDPSTGELVLSAATPQGRALLEGSNFAVPQRIRDVTRGAAELQRIQDDATFLRSQGVTDASLIWQTSPDQRDNRALITISAMSRPLLDALAQRFPPDAVAVRVDPAQLKPGT